MARCPACESEFDDGTEECPDCRVPLVQRSEEVESEDVDCNLPSDGLVVIESTPDNSRIGKLRELLEEGGIPCFLSNELFPMDPPTLIALLETQVLIPREMEGDAKRLIRGYFD